jgi:hypothetical protein
VACAAAAALLLSGGAAQAVSTLVFQAQVIADGGRGTRARVLAGGRNLMTLAGHGSRSAAAANEVARRLNALTEEGLQASEISVWRERRARLIVARRQKLVTVDKQMAAAHGTGVEELARAWAGNLRAVLGQPYLAMKTMVVPVGETRVAELKGNIFGTVMVRVESPVASVAWDEQAGVVRAAGLQDGESELVVTDERSLLRVPLSVMKYAAQVGELVTAAVTGNPAPAEVVTKAVKAAVAAGVRLEPGAWGRVTPTDSGVQALYRGGEREAPVLVFAAGQRYLPCRTQRQVTIRNERLHLAAPGVLMVSNSPERLRSQGLWFEGKLADNQSARLLYHHVNGTGSTGDLVVEAWNLGETMARVHVMAGVGGPSYDESWAGHRAAIAFLQSKAAGAGWVVPVQPGTAVALVTQPVGGNATVSGVLELRALGAANLSLRVYLAPHMLERMPRPITGYAESPLLGQWHYLEPQRALQADYVAGQQWTFLTIGKQPVPGMRQGDELAGGYGVLYDIDLGLTNPTGQEARVEIAMEPAGGPARGALVVDGRVVETAMLSRDAEATVAKFALAPGEARRVRIQTMPQAGSNYPVRLVVRPA